ncbi:2Fe-2S iron-sulfur cluster-binding protein [Streptomyces sp. TRM64462]|uniref:2Fe-2S iron-sulfur cluster-binding protein n=1 Tax=Streptomyces sp. TRM64462 TaxID=2741726 RepID=UPI001586BAFF|nr:2Fe-2S iron-sulfur cluster-binding protein [Streptomyces sp. TRM64462]
MTTEEHGHGHGHEHEQGPEGGGGWQPTPQGEYDGDATAFVQLPPGAALDGIPLEAPGHGYVPPHIADPHATAHWNFQEALAAEQAAAGTSDLTGQWTIPVAEGDLPEESGEYQLTPGASAWPTTLPGGAPAPWTLTPEGPAAHPEQHVHTPPAGTAMGGLPEAGGHADAAADAAAPTAEGAPDGHAAPQGHGASTDLPGPGGDTVPGGLPAGATVPGGLPGGDVPLGVPLGDDVLPGRLPGGHALSGDAAPGGQAPSGGDGGPGGLPVPDGHAVPGGGTAPTDASGDHAMPGGHAMPGAAASAAPGGLAVPGGSEAAARPAGPDGSEGPVGAGPAGPVGPVGSEGPTGPEEHPATTGSAMPGSDAAPGGHSGPGATGPTGATGAPGTSPFDGGLAHGAVDGPAGREAAEPDAAAEQDGPGPDAPGAPGAAGAHGEPDTPAAQAGDDASDAEPAAPQPAADDTEDPDHTDHTDDPDHPSTPVPPGDEHPHVSYVLRVNGTDRPVTDAWIGESLLYVLRERLGLAGAKDGCSQGECGACNVQVDGRLVASCLVPAATAAGSEVRTVEGLASHGEPSDVQRALVRCGAVQCGFCIPGMAMTMHDLLEGNHTPTDREARKALSGNLCRCTGYQGALRAVREVIAEREASAAAAKAAADATTDSAPGGAPQQQHPEVRIPHQVPHPHDGGTA